MEIDKFLSQINSKRLESHAKIALQIQQLEIEGAQYSAVLTKLECILPTLANLLTKAKLTINKITWSWNYCYNNALNVHVTCNTNGYKLIKFAGFTANGAGRNQKQLEKKAIQLQNLLKHDSLPPINVNPCSLEYVDGCDNKTGSILLEFSLR